ncbi:helix-turn-helix transcriptional regulator [Pseudahrensia aquimaris]|uniref:Helix-turn-helix transcriptional regulator n=1 Tax=Pseudahrensia aquimaris TaxID=744461 RepID=A0ABW3FDE5_9HYPH
MNVRTLCLAILNLGDSTGYEIRKLSTEGHFTHFVDASYGSIYPALNKLEVDGMVTSREEIQVGKPARKVYSITDQGRAAFAEALTRPVGKDVFKSEFLLLAMNAEIMDPAHVVRAINAQIDYLTSELAIIDEAQGSVDMEGADWVAEYGRTCIQVSIDYIKAHRGSLEAIAGKRFGEYANQAAIAAE